MGLIRKTLAVGTIGAVNGSSKKQRANKEQTKQLMIANLLMEAAARDEPITYKEAAKEADAQLMLPSWLR